MYKVEENPLKIKTLSVGKLKFTKSLFNQVIMKDPFNKDLVFKGESYYGFVKTDSSRHLIWIYKGQLRVCSLGDHMKIAQIHEHTRLDRSNKQLLEGYGLSVGMGEYGDGSKFPYLEMDMKSEKRLLILIANANKFLGEISGHQIFL